MDDIGLIFLRIFVNFGSLIRNNFSPNNAVKINGKLQHIEHENVSENVDNIK